MKTIEHIYAIKGLLSSGPASDDFNYSNRLILHFLQAARAFLIEQKIDKYHNISAQSFQSLCLDLEKDSYHDCCGIDFPDCEVLKSTIELPKFLNSRWGPFVNVTDLEGHVLSAGSITTNSLSKYSIVEAAKTTKTPYWMIRNNRLIILNNTDLKTVLLDGLFADPTGIKSINCSEALDECQDILESEFPMDSDLVTPMYKLTLEFLGKSLMIYPVDNENNAQGNSGPDEIEGMA